MRSRLWSLIPSTLALAFLLAVKNPAHNEEPPINPAPQQGVEVQARGPIHEAYAEPTEMRPQPSVIEPKQPPEPIDEIPSDQKPASDDAVWMPGYWSWDEDQKDFLWISGFWRVPPPNRQWVSGHWQQVEN